MIIIKNTTNKNMKIILSPSKTQDIFETNKPVRATYQFRKKTNNLFEYFRLLDKAKLGKVLNIKNKLLDFVYNIYHVKQEAFPAIQLYSGVVFEQIQFEHYNQEQQLYLNQNVSILSAMYGPISPDTKVYPYRLDMTIKPKKINLYHYWQEVVDEYFQESDIIVNLASNEFSKMIKHNKDKMIYIHFLEEQKNGTEKVISYNAKKARGMMLHQMIVSQIENIEDLKAIVTWGYKFNPDKSNNQNFYFIKELA